MDDNEWKKITKLIDDILVTSEVGSDVELSPGMPRLSVMGTIHEEWEEDIDPEDYGIEKHYASLILEIPCITIGAKDEFDSPYKDYFDYLDNTLTEQKH